ncbi:MAG: hypothetical protein ACO3FE_06940 [Planctomycetaceae bacterium]
MIELGYMAKQIVSCAGWFRNPAVQQVVAVSSCISADFCDPGTTSQCNRWRCFNSPQIIQEVAAAAGISLDGISLLYYRAAELQFDRVSGKWSRYDTDHRLETHVRRPETAELLGWDVVSFAMQNAAECS